MTWKNVLKMMTPRMFLQNIQNIIGGEISGGSSRAGDNFTLDSDRGKITVKRRGGSAYRVNYGDFNTNVYDLQSILPTILDSLNGEMEKVAGTVTTSSAAHKPLFSEGRTGGNKNAKDEEKD